MWYVQTSRRQFCDDIDRFLRVSFVDEDWEKMHSVNLCSRPSSSGDLVEGKFCLNVCFEIWTNWEHGWEISRTSKTWRNMPPDLANPLNLLKKLPTSTRKLSLRKSMLKYESSNTKLDVLSWSKYQPCYLNLQIITLLSMLGISDEVFERKQRVVVSQLDDMLTDSNKAQEFLEFPESNDQGTKTMLITTPTASTLEPVVVAKISCYHPGDVRVLKAVDVRGLHVPHE
nr:probable RNA-dependent RNA polymerase 1 [Ipomoea batatas]